jgi:RimJ/RimL family protein N-acetyltransferase
MADNCQFIQLDPSQVTPELMALFNPTDPAALRCQAVLEAHAAGKIFADHPETPSWAVVQEATFGSIYLGGMLDAGLVQSIIAALLLNGDVLVGLTEKDPRWALFPPQADYVGHTLEFTDREMGGRLPDLPAGCELRRLDASLGKQIVGRNLLIHMYGSMQLALQWGYGLCLLREGELLCEAFGGPAAGGIIEIGVETHPHHLHRGYGKITCAHLIDTLEQLGYQTYWNCAQANLASAALARKLGFRAENQYRLMAWFGKGKPGVQG